MTGTDLAGRVAIVTGGGRGLGRGSAERLAAAGAAVAVLGRSPDSLDQTVQAISTDGGTALAVQCNVTDPADRANAVSVVNQHLGVPTALVNNAGIIKAGLPHEVTADDWREVFETNIHAPFFLAQELYPGLRDAGGGAIVNIASVYARRAAVAVSSYGASKAALCHLTMSLAHAWAADKVRVNAVLPGVVETEMTSASVTNPVIRQKILDFTPAGELAAVEHVADTVHFLLSPRAASVTGQAIAVDGGILLKDPMYP